MVGLLVVIILVITIAIITKIVIRVFPTGGM